MGAGSKESMILSDYENIYNTFKKIKNTPGLSQTIYATNKTVSDELTNFQNYLISETDNYEGKDSPKTKGQFTDNKLAIKIYKSLGGIMLSETQIPSGRNPMDSVNNYLSSVSKGKQQNTNTDSNKRTRKKVREAFY